MYIYIWVVDVAGRLKKEPDFFLNYHNSGSFYFWLLLKREISDKRCHCWTFTIFTYQAFIDFHSRPSHIYITFWVTHFCEHQPAQSTRGLNAGQMRSCLQPFDQAVQWNLSWEFKYHCLVRLFFFSSGLPVLQEKLAQSHHEGWSQPMLLQSAAQATLQPPTERPWHDD